MRALIACALAAQCCWGLDAVTLVDFQREGHGWKGNARTRGAVQAEGFRVALTGAEDPWLEGPAVDVPGFGAATRLAVTLEADSDVKGPFLLFYAPEGSGFSEERMVSLRRALPASREYAGYVPAAAPRMRFRLDPPGCEGVVTLRALKAAALIPLATPPFARPSLPVLPSDALRAAAGRVSVAHDPVRWNAWACAVDGQSFAVAAPEEALLYWAGQKTVEVPLSGAAVTAQRTKKGFVVRARLCDEGGAEWALSREFVAAEDGLRMALSVEASQAREVLHLPWLTLFAGVGTFGESKSQALQPGVEYLEDEPSSNEKEIRGAAANRRLVDRYKICYPMMALAADGRWLSLSWRAGPLPVTPLFDSPDRVFHSGGHVMGLWSPAVGAARFDGDLTVYGGVRLEAGVVYRCECRLAGGEGDVVTAAIADYVQAEGLPQQPLYEGGFDAAVRLLAGGWLDSAARDGTQWRHAVWGSSFPAQPAQDPPAYMLWLAAHTGDVSLRARLKEGAQSAISAFPKGCFGTDGISHVRRPVGAFVYGNLEGLVRQAGPHAAQLAKQLADGRARYRPAKVDYASTLGADHCNGFSAIAAEDMLASASLTGDEAAIAASLAALDRMTASYAGQVPRGAQPWEMPLHTPDILASARLVRCYVLGYLLSGRQEHLEQARYWAWTGAAMVYLSRPTDGAVGEYATIGVIGATNWQAPNWIGQPVQWCGLVYRSALEELARVDADGRPRWQALARGITLAGLQMCFPLGDPERRGGLLPDFYLLKAQLSDGPAINPGTLQTHLGEAYGKAPHYSVARLAGGVLVHAPGDVRSEPAAEGALRVQVDAWPQSEYRVLVTRLDKAPASAAWDGTPIKPLYVPEARAAIFSVCGSGTLHIER
jgi:hypothetical protein